jgi:hypothetical protein
MLLVLLVLYEEKGHTAENLAGYIHNVKLGVQSAYSQSYAPLPAGLILGWNPSFLAWEDFLPIHTYS